MNIQRLHTRADKPIQSQINWKTVKVLITRGDEVLCDVPRLTVPEHWSQNAADILAHKYLRKAGVPAATTTSRRDRNQANWMPEWLLHSYATDDTKGTSGEVSAQQVFHRIAGHWTHAAWVGGYLKPDNEDHPTAYLEDGGKVDYSPRDRWRAAAEENARAFYDELYWMLAMQWAAPNSPQWFNTGLWWAYGMAGYTENSGWQSSKIGAAATETGSSYRYPQTSACFILGIEDSLLGADGILGTLAKEARIFKYGSGSGINYSSLRPSGAPLSNGGVSSGMMSFLDVFDRNGGSIKSGGTTRRAARMVVVDADHPEAMDFVTWKQREELKVAAMANGARGMRSPNPVSQDTLNSLTTDYESAAYHTVGGQNANNSLRVTDGFMHTVSQDGAAGSKADLWDATIYAAWACGDPGIQFHDTCNRWHTIPKVAPQRATNPCSEFSFIDNSACNLASINLVRFWDARTGVFDAAAFEHTVRLWTIVLDVTVGMSSYPDKKVAENSTDYRPLGLGYANLGGLLMLMGLPYDSSEGREAAAIITSLLQATAWETSAELASSVGPFRDFETHAADVARILELHREANAALTLYTASKFRSDIGLNLNRDDDAGDTSREVSGELPVATGSHVEPGAAVDTVREGSDGVARRQTSDADAHPLIAAMDAATAKWETLGGWRGADCLPIRNAQLSLLAPTGTIGLVMDCATTGVEPDFSLVKLKKLAGGGSMTIVNPLVGDALRGLGYTDSEVADIEAYVTEHGRVDESCPHIDGAHIAVFDCAGDISWKGHIDMMAAVQPFLSGAISKTVNMPNSATVADVESAYVRAWKSGLKAVAIYRDGCKLSQPLTAVRTADPVAPDAVSLEPVAPGSPESAVPAVATFSVTKLKQKGRLATRYKLPSRRRGFTQKVRIGGQSLYLRTGEYADGSLGEVFLTVAREGSTMKHLVDALAITMSIGLQHGVPLAEYIDAFADSKSEPNGMVQGSDNVRFCSSLLDYVAKELSATYLHDGEAERVDGIERIPLQPVKKEEAGGDGDEEDDENDVVERKHGLRTMAAPRYVGDACPSCHSFTLRRNGSCFVCDSCGQTTGCS